MNRGRGIPPSWRACASWKRIARRLGNVILLLLNLPLAETFAKLLRVPYALLYPMLALCIAGVYSQASSVSDLWLASAFGVFGYFMRRLCWGSCSSRSLRTRSGR
jgi:TctA family transporter